MKQNRKKSLFQRLTNLLFLAVFLYSFVKLGSLLYGYYENRQVLAEVQEIYRSSENEIVESLTSEGQQIRSPFHDLVAINEDIVGWVTVNDTRIDYPILQAADNDYYMERNYKKEQMRAGSIFMDFRNNISNEDRHTILYGHRMKDGTMFGHLKKYLEEDFFNEHRVFYYDTLYDSYDVEIFSVYKTTTDFYYIQTDFSNDQEYKTFIQELQDKSMYKTDIEIQPDDRIITLSTCDYGLSQSEGRLVVHAKLVPKK